ncbi:MAG: ABC transporter substrate-binding protein [Suipraeoptans sp.]
MKKTLCTFIILCMTICLCACTNAVETVVQEESEDLIVVGFTQVGAESDWRAANTKSMQEAFSEANGYKLIFDDAQQKQERQITAIRNFIQQRVDYIVLAPTTMTGWDTVLSEAKAADIPVIIVDREIETDDTSLFTCWVGSDFINEGEKAVTWLEETLNDKANEELINIVHLQGNLDSSAQIGRTTSLDKGLENNEKWNLLARGSGEFTQAKGQEVMEQFLSEYEDIDVLYSENDNMTYGAIDAMEAVGITPGEDIIIISFDANRSALELSLEGKINYIVECNPLHGPRVSTIIEQLEKGEKPQKFTYVEETAFDMNSLTKEMIEKRAY